MLVAAISAVGPVTIDMYLPGFPDIERDLGPGVETTMAAYMFGLSIGQLFYGPISDRFGRKPPLYFGLALYGLGSLGCVLATSMTMLTLMRVVQALGGCTGFVIGRAIVRDRCEPHEAARAFSTLMLIFALGPMIAPIAGGFVVTAFGWRAVFVFQCALAAGLLLLTYRGLAESRNPANVVPLSLTSVMNVYLRLLRSRELIGYSLVGGFGMGSMFSYVTGSPTVMTHLFDLTPQQFGWLIGLNGVAFMSASRLNMRSLNTIGPAEVLRKVIWRPLVFGALLVAISFYAGIALWMIVLLQFGFFISVGRVGPNVAALALAPHAADAGSAAAFMGTLQTVVAMLAGTAVAIFNDDTLTNLAILMATGVTLAWVSWKLTYASADQRPTANSSRPEQDR